MENRIVVIDVTQRQDDRDAEPDIDKVRKALRIEPDRTIVIANPGDAEVDEMYDLLMQFFVTGHCIALLPKRLAPPVGTKPELIQGKKPVGIRMQKSCDIQELRNLIHSTQADEIAITSHRYEPDAVESALTVFAEDGLIVSLASADYQVPHITHWLSM